MSFSDYLEDYVLDLIFGNTNYWRPWISVGLSLTDPMDDGSGLMEPNAIEYARIQTETIDWYASYLGGVDNIYPLIFPTAENYWGIVTHFVLFDEDYYGAMLAYGEVLPNMTIDAGQVPSFDTGELLIAID